MEFGQILQLILALVSAGTAIFVTWLGYSLRKREATRDAEDARRLEQERIEREKQLKEEERKKIETEALVTGMQAILRDRIIQMHSYCKQKGHVPFYMSENMDRMYKAYKELNGNGVVAHVVEDFKKIPTMGSTD